MFEKIIAKTARSLEKNNIPYMLIGGQAVLLYGSPRLTKDIDITLGVGMDKLDSIKKVLINAGLEPIPDNPDDFAKRTFVLPARDKKSHIRVDFIFSFSPYEKEAIERAQGVRIGRTNVKFARPEDIIIHKIFAGRPRDIEDARIILLKNPSCDLKYIEKWLKEFNKMAEDKNLLRIFKELKKNP